MWNFDNSYARLPKTFYTLVDPAPVREPKLIIFNDVLAGDLGLNAQALQSDEGVKVLAGNQVPEGAMPLAQAYAGHQFGHFTMLGDGRAVLLGEQVTPSGKKLDIQLKGSGETPYSRRGDGRAAVGPMLREYIISEAMYGLGIPTTRSLAVVATGEPVFREFKQPGAILTRVAASHLRVGTFQYASQWGTGEDLKSLTDYTLQRHFLEVHSDLNPYLILLHEVIKRQAELIAKWQLVGFVHGVMNTDNMALSGETIDYGPCAFMDAYDPATVFSSIDSQGRYAYGNQPHIGAWNLARFAETLLPLLHDEEKEAIKLAENEISKFSGLFHDHWLAGMRSKLGIGNEEAEDESLAGELLIMMKKNKADFTHTFRALTLNLLESSDLFDTTEFTEWNKTLKARQNRQEGGMAAVEKLMKNANPAVIPRNHLVEEALEAAVEKEDYSVMENLLHALANPYAYSPEQEKYTKIPEQPSYPYQTFCGT